MHKNASSLFLNHYIFHRHKQISNKLIYLVVKFEQNALKLDQCKPEAGWLAGWLAGPQAWLAGPQAWLAGSQAWLNGPEGGLTDGWMNGRTNGKSPHSTGLRPLSGPLPCLPP